MLRSLCYFLFVSLLISSLWAKPSQCRLSADFFSSKAYLGFRKLVRFSLESTGKSYKQFNKNEYYEAKNAYLESMLLGFIYSPVRNGNELIAFMEAYRESKKTSQIKDFGIVGFQQVIDSKESLLDLDFLISQANQWVKKKSVEEKELREVISFIYYHNKITPLNWSRLLLTPNRKIQKEYTKDFENISSLMNIYTEALTNLNIRIISEKKENFKDDVIKFEQLNVNLSNLNTRTIKKPKIQETSTLKLINCFIK